MNCSSLMYALSEAGLSAKDVEILPAARSLGAGRVQLLFFVVLPAALPDILVGLRIGMGVGWTTLVAAEMVASSPVSGRWCSTPRTSFVPIS